MIPIFRASAPTPQEDALEEWKQTLKNPEGRDRVILEASKLGSSSLPILSKFTETEETQLSVKDLRAIQSVIASFGIDALSLMGSLLKKKPLFEVSFGQDIQTYAENSNENREWRPFIWDLTIDLYSKAKPADKMKIQNFWRDQIAAGETSLIHSFEDSNIDIETTKRLLEKILEKITVNSTDADFEDAAVALDLASNLKKRGLELNIDILEEIQRVVGVHVSLEKGSAAFNLLQKIPGSGNTIAAAKDKVAQALFLRPGRTSTYSHYKPLLRIAAQQGEKGQKYILETLQSNWPYLRQEALQVGGELLGRAAIPILNKALFSTDDFVPFSAAQGLAKIEDIGPSDLDDLVKATTNVKQAFLEEYFDVNFPHRKIRPSADEIIGKLLSNGEELFLEDILHQFTGRVNDPVKIIVPIVNKTSARGRELVFNFSIREIFPEDDSKFRTDYSISLYKNMGREFENYPTLATETQIQYQKHRPLFEELLKNKESDLLKALRGLFILMKDRELYQKLPAEIRDEK